MVGEPLSAPFAHPGSAAWNSPATGSVLSGLAAFNLSFSAADTNLPLTQVDLFVDGAFVQTLTNLPPSPGNILSVTIGGVTASYTVASGDSLDSAASGLAFNVAERNRDGGRRGGRPRGAALADRGHAGQRDFGAGRRGHWLGPGPDLVCHSGAAHVPG